MVTFESTTWRRKGIVWILAWLVLGLVPRGSSACTTNRLILPPIWIQGDACLDGEVTVTIHGYATFAANNDVCACALNLPGTIGEVISAEIVDAATGTVLTAFNFSDDPDADFGGSPNWQGFSSAVSAIVGGQEVDLRFRVVVPPGGDCNGLAERTRDALRDPVGPGTIGTGGADVYGVPNHHIVVARAGCVVRVEDLLFEDDFESGDVSSWSAVSQ